LTVKTVYASLTTLLLLCPAAAPWASGQIQTSAPDDAAARRTMTALRISDDETIVLDGRLDEEVWRRAVPAADFIQQDPDNGQPATEPTEVRIVFNSHSLYMGVTCYDSSPEEWIGFQRRRDEFLPSDDRFMWNFDTFNNQQTAYFFEMNPSGLMGDALRGAGFNSRQWDGIWDARARRSEIGWTLEIEIPFRTLAFDPGADGWGVNFQRTVRRKNEESLWSGWLRNQGLQRLTAAGQLTGIRDISMGRGIDVKPYLLGAVESFPGRGDSSVHEDVGIGVDVFYSPTPSLRTNFTVNTDFAQTELDQRLVNLTRFPQFFPEKRDFFLDGSSFFDFQSTAQGGNTLLPFFSRTIGLDADGHPQKIDVGGKAAGQIGRNDLGAMYVRTGDEETVEGEDFLVLRGRRRLLTQSYVGALYTGRSGQPGFDSAHTLGVDFLLATSTFLGSENLSVGGFFLNTTNALDTGKNNAFGIALTYPNDPWSGGVFYREIQDNYDAALGFTPRTGYRRVSPNVSRTFRPQSHPWIRTIVFGADANFQMDTDDNRLLDREIDLTMLQVNTHTLDSFQVHVLPTYERLEEDFPISPGVTLPAFTDYSWNRYRFQASTAQRRMVSISPTLEVGSFYNGTRRRIAFDLNLRLRPGLIIYTSGEWNRVELDEGSFETRVYRFVPELQFSPWVAWVNNIQFDTQSNVLGWQSRFRWILRPGNDLYVVYTHNWQDDPLDRRMRTLDRRAASKVLYTHRF